MQTLQDLMKPWLRWYIRLSEFAAQRPGVITQLGFASMALAGLLVASGNVRTGAAFLLLGSFVGGPGRSLLGRHSGKLPVDYTAMGRVMAVGEVAVLLALLMAPETARWTSFSYARSIQLPIAVLLIAALAEPLLARWVPGRKDMLLPAIIPRSWRVILIGTVGFLGTPVAFSVLLHVLAVAAILTVVRSGLRHRGLDDLLQVGPLPDRPIVSRVRGGFLGWHPCWHLDLATLRSLVGFAIAGLILYIIGSVYYHDSHRVLFFEHDDAIIAGYFILMIVLIIAYFTTLNVAMHRRAAESGIARVPMIALLSGLIIPGGGQFYMAQFVPAVPTMILSVAGLYVQSGPYWGLALWILAAAMAYRRAVATAWLDLASSGRPVAETPEMAPDPPPGDDERADGDAARSATSNHGKSRHGCLTAFLVVMIAGNALSALVYLFMDDHLQRALPGTPTIIAPISVLLALANIASAIALYHWKKWGFYGFVGTSSIAFIMNVAVGVNVLQSLAGLLGVAFLYGVLQIGSDNKGWVQLD